MACCTKVKKPSPLKMHTSNLASFTQALAPNRYHATIELDIADDN